MIGEEGLEIYNTFQFSEEEADKLVPLKAKFKSYCIPKTNVTFERYKFNTRTQHDSEQEGLRRERVLRDKLHPFDVHNVTELLARYRCTRPNLMAIIDSLSADLLFNVARVGCLISTSVVLVTLRVLAAGSFQPTCQRSKSPHQLVVVTAHCIAQLVMK